MNIYIKKYKYKKLFIYKQFFRTVEYKILKSGQYNISNQYDIILYLTIVTHY